MSKHTKHAWMITGEYHDPTLTKIHIGYSHKDDNDPTVSLGYLLSDDYDEAKANAQLVIAAPELLQACEETRVKLLDIFGVFGGGPKVNELFDLLNKAIEKATGKKEATL